VGGQRRGLWLQPPRPPPTSMSPETPTARTRERT
jgi:hypothetical protein